MKKIKSVLVGILAALIILASLGAGIMLVGMAIVIGGASALAIHLNTGNLQKKLKQRVEVQGNGDPIGGEGVLA